MYSALKPSLSAVGGLCSSHGWLCRDLNRLGVDDQVEEIPLVVGDLKSTGGYVFFEVGDAAGTGDGEDDGAAMEEPCQRELTNGRIVPCREVRDGMVRFAAGGSVLRDAGSGAAAHGVPGEEGDGVLLAEVDGGFGGSVGEVVAVLDADDGDDLLGGFDLLPGDFGETDVADLALLLGVAEGSKGVFEGDRGIDAVELVEVDAFEPKVAEGEFELLLEIVGAAAGFGFRGPLPRQATFCGNDQVGWIGMEGFGDELFPDLGPVGVGGVEERDAEFEGSAEDVAGVFAGGRFAPGTFADETHGAVGEAVDGEVAAEIEGAGEGCVSHRHSPFDGRGHIAVGWGRVLAGFEGDSQVCHRFDLKDEAWFSGGHHASLFAQRLVPGNQEKDTGEPRVNVFVDGSPAACEDGLPVLLTRSLRFAEIWIDAPLACGTDEDGPMHSIGQNVSFEGDPVPGEAGRSFGHRAKLDYLDCSGGLRGYLR